jgi:hypothetical protein
MKTTSGLGIIVLAAVFVATAGATTSGQSPAVGPAVKPAAVAKRAGAAGSKTTTVAGKNKTKIGTANQPGDDDSFWMEAIDVDGDGDVEDANVVWDDEDKVLFTYTTGSFTCKNGGTASGDLLIAVNGDGNPRSGPRDRASGWPTWMPASAACRQPPCGVASSTRPATRPRAAWPQSTRRTTTSSSRKRRSPGTT